MAPLMATAQSRSAESSPHIILVGTDLGPTSRIAVAQAWQLATQRPDGELHLAYVIPDGGGLSKNERLLRRERLLEKVPNWVRNRAIQVAQAYNLAPLNRAMAVHVRIGKPAAEILQLAADLDAAMIVVGSHGRRGIERAVMGSVAESLVRAARLPVLVCRPKNFAGVAHTEELEPPCPDCLAARDESDGARLWCELHGRPRVKTHTYRASHSGKPPFDSQGALSNYR